MTAPFAPDLLTPANKGASASASVTLTWKFKSVIAGDYMATYAVRRRAMTPSIGSYEYWNGTTWQASEYFLTGSSSVLNGVTASITITTGWTTDKIYQWSVKCRNLAAEASSYADDNLIQIHAAPAMTVTVSSTSVSRPKIQWVWSGASGYYMRSYRIAIYTAAVQGASGFDASSAEWQALATFLSDTKYGSNDWYMDVTEDLASGTQYYVYYLTEDTAGLSSGWVNGTNFTPSYTAVPPPAITLTRDEESGVVACVVRSSFNLLSDEASIFTTGIESWVGSLNCETSWDSVNSRLKMKVGGMSYAALDAAHTTFAATDTAYTTFENMRTTMASPSGTSRALSGDQAGELVAVTPAVVYSACATLTNAASTSRTAKIGIRWYKSDGSASTTPLTQGSGTACPNNTPTVITVSGATAPADAAWAAIELEWTTSVVDDIMYADNVAFASAASISWSPASGGFDIHFALEHSHDNETWTPVWACAQDDPHASDVGAVSQISLDDRSCPLGVETIYYRAWAISNLTTAPVWSSVATGSVSGMKPAKWWLRRPEQTTADSDVRVITPDFSSTVQLNRDVQTPDGATHPVVSYSAAPDAEVVELKITSLDQETYDAVLEALKSSETLYLHSNVPGQSCYLRAVDSIRKTMRRAQPTLSTMVQRHMFEIEASAVVVKDPY